MTKNTTDIGVRVALSARPDAIELGALESSVFNADIAMFLSELQAEFIALAALASHERLEHLTQDLGLTTAQLCEADYGSRTFGSRRLGTHAPTAAHRDAIHSGS
ncbi:MAG: hypothetical protein ACUVQI_09545 [Thermochromatium sp.]